MINSLINSLVPFITNDRHVIARNYMVLAHIYGAWCMFIRMHVPSQTERILFVASKAVRGLLCPSPLLLLRSLSRVP